MREDVFFGQVHAYHYAAVGDPAYALLIVHGIGGHGGTYDIFCEPLAARGVEVYSMDLPGHGKARNENGNWRFSEWLEDIDIAAKEIRERLPGKEIFILGSSQGSNPAFHSLATSEAISGAIIMGMATLHEEPPPPDSVAGKLYFELNAPEAAATAARVGDTQRFDLTKVLDWNTSYAKDDPDILAKKRLDPLRAWSYGYASLHSMYAYRPPTSPSENTKPLLVTVGEDDPICPTPYVVRSFEKIGGPKELAIVEKGTHQLMLYHTDVYVPLVDDWVRRHLTDKSRT